MIFLLDIIQIVGGSGSAGVPFFVVNMLNRRHIDEKERYL